MMRQKKRGDLSKEGGGCRCSRGPITRPVCVYEYACLIVCQLCWLQVPWRALGWPRFQSARRLCWLWGSLIRPLARRPDTPSSRKQGIRFFPVYVLLRPCSSSTPSTISNPHLINKLTPLQLLSTHVSAHLLRRLWTAHFYIQTLCCCNRREHNQGVWHNK